VACASLPVAARITAARLAVASALLGPAGGWGLVGLDGWLLRLLLLLLAVAAAAAAASSSSAAVACMAVSRPRVGLTG
jgi:hypothetical protein